MTTYGAMRRHMLKWLEGEEIDSESGIHHLKHAFVNMAFLIEFIERLDLDDRPGKEKQDDS